MASNTEEMKSTRDESISNFMKKKKSTVKKSGKKVQNRICSQDSMVYSKRESTGTVDQVLKVIGDNYMSLVSQQKSSVSNTVDLSDVDRSWRGWIILNEVKPIALMTTDPVEKRSKFSGKLTNIDESIIERIVSSLSDSRVIFEPNVVPIKNAKLKVKHYEMSDLEIYNTKFKQLSGTSLFKGDSTGLHQVDKRGAIYSEITSKYNLPDVFKEKGSQASSTELRIFKATVALKKQPTCSLNEKSRERLFLMFSPSDDNVLDIINNSQIKNKLLRHEIGKYLKPQRKVLTKSRVINTTNAPLYSKRNLPPLVPVTDLGNIKDAPPLTIEKLFDLFFKENVVEKDGYSILVKEQPLLVENITLCVLPTNEGEKKIEIKREGFVPRYSFKDRENEEITEEVTSLETQTKKRYAKSPESIAERLLTRGPDYTYVKKVLLENKLLKSPALKDDMDEHLNRLCNYLTFKEADSSNDLLPKPHGNLEDDAISQMSSRKHLSKWDKFEMAGDKARLIKQKVDKTYNEVLRPSMAKPSFEFRSETEDRTTHGSLSSSQGIGSYSFASNATATGTGTVYTQGLSQRTSNPAEPDILEEGTRASAERILKQVKDNGAKLKKDIILPVVHPMLPDVLPTGKKRFYMNRLQQYWSECHRDVKNYYHNPLEKTGHYCGVPVISKDRTEALSHQYQLEPEDEDSTQSSTSLPKETVPIEPIFKEGLPPIVTPAAVDEIKHELACPKYTYAHDKKIFRGIAPSTFYKNSKKEIVTLTYCERFLKNYYSRYDKRRKLFMCTENEYGVQKLVSTTIKPNGLPFKELDTWQSIAKYVASNVDFIPLENPLFLPHVLSSPSQVLRSGRGNPFEVSTLLASLLIGQGYDAYVVSGYANILLTQVESTRNYLRYECPFLISELPSNPFEVFQTPSHVTKMIEKAKKPIKEMSNYKPTIAPYLDSSYIRQTKLDKEREREEEAARIAFEDEEIACKRYLGLFEKDDLEGMRIHSWVLVLSEKRDVENAFFLEASSGIAYSTEDPHYYGIESLWNDQNYWICLSYLPHCPSKSNETKEISEEDNGTTDEKISKTMLVFDLANPEVWLPLLINGPQMFKDKAKKKDFRMKILRLQTSLDMPSSWCARISITANQIEQRINLPMRTSLFKRAVCHDYQVGFHDGGLVAKVIRFLDLNRTDPDFEVQLFERRRDLMYRRRREIVSDKLTEYFSFGRDDCLKAHEFIEGADAMYCDHNLYFYWDCRDDGLKSVHMTDLFLKLDYGGRKDKLNSILVLYGGSIEQGKKGKRKGAEPEESGKTPRKEIQTIIQEFLPSPDKTPWTDFAKMTYKVTKGQITVDFQYEAKRITVTSKFIKKSHDDPELEQAMAEITKRKRNRDDDDDNLSELDLEAFDQELDIDDDDFSSSDDGKDMIGMSSSEKKYRKAGKSKKSGKEKDQDAVKGKKSDINIGSEESVKSSATKSSAQSEASYGLSDLECTSESEKEQPSFYPVKLEADKDKSIWARSQKNRKIIDRVRSNLPYNLIPKNRQSDDIMESEINLSAKIKDFGHLTKESSAESSDEEEEFIKELRKRQFKAINETKEVYKAIERDEANPNISSLIGVGKSKKYDVCKLDRLIDRVLETEEDDKTIVRMKKKLDESLHKKSLNFPNETVSFINKRSDYNIKFSMDDKKTDENGDYIKGSGQRKDSMEKYQKIGGSIGDSQVVVTSLPIALEEQIILKPKQRNIDKEKSLKKINEIDPLVIGIYDNADRCLEDSYFIKNKKQVSKGGMRLRNVFASNVEENGSDEKLCKDYDSDSVTFRKDGEATISEEEVANEKDVDSVEGEVYNSDDNYSLQSKNASSREYESTEEYSEECEKKGEDFSGESENESVIEYQTEAPTHTAYDFEGFHFQAGKMYARKLYQLKEVCDNAAIDSDQQSSYDDEEDYDAKFLEGEIDKFLENTVDRITQDVREARYFIGLKKGSETNFDQTGIYYCSLNDKYINYVDSYFRKINKKRELQSDKALFMEMMKQRAKEPDKIIRHIREYVLCKKQGTDMKLDENLMNLIPHVRPVEVKKKDRLGYEILTDDDEDDGNVTHLDLYGEEETMKPEAVRESIEPVNITLAELMERLGGSPNSVHLTDAVNNFKKFKDMETVNQLIELPVHECFSDVNIRNHLQSSKVNDGYFIDANIGGKVIKADNCHADLGFVTDPEHILLSKDIESAVSSATESEEEEQEMKLKHMEVMATCGKETIKEADFFEPIYKQDMKKADDPFRPDKFRMFVPLEPRMLDSDSDGSINNRIKEKRRKAQPQKVIEEIEEYNSRESIQTTITTLSMATSNIQQRLDIDRTFGLEPIEAPHEMCRVGVRNMSVNDEVSNVDKALSLDNFLTMEDEAITYIRNIEAYINNLLIRRRRERQSTKRHILRMSRKGTRRANFRVLQQKLEEFNQMADNLSFGWDLLAPYLHLLLPQDGQNKFTYNTSNYLIRCLIIDFIEKELYKLKDLYHTYDKAREAVVEKKNVFLSDLENMSFKEKTDYEKKVTEMNGELRRISDKAHVLRFVILRRAKQSTRRFLRLIDEIKVDDRLRNCYNEAKERLIMIDLSKRWPEHFEFIMNFSGLPVASEPNDFTTSYISPLDDMVIRKIIKQTRKKPAKYLLSEKSYERYLDLMERDREYFEGMKKKEVPMKKKRSIHSIFLGSKLEECGDRKYASFIDKLEIINDLDWADFINVTDSEEEVVEQHSARMKTISTASTTMESRKPMPYDICSKSLIEELITIKEIESSVKMSKDSGSFRKTLSYVTAEFEIEQDKKDAQFFEFAGTPLARKYIQEKLPDYFEYI